MDKPCKCSDAKCLITSSCCFCADSRSAHDVKTYVDEYGYLNTDYIPQDIHYCANCKITEGTLVQIVEELKKTLPPHEYRTVQTFYVKQDKATARLKEYVLKHAIKGSMYKSEKASKVKARAKDSGSSKVKYVIPVCGLSNRHRERGPKTKRVAV